MVHFLKVFKLGLTSLKLLITFGLSDWLIGLIGFELAFHQQLWSG